MEGFFGVIFMAIVSVTNCVAYIKFHSIFFLFYCKLTVFILYLSIIHWTNVSHCVKRLSFVRRGLPANFLGE